MSDAYSIDTKPSKINKSIGPGVAGAGCGTLMVMIASGLPQQSIYRTLLTYLAPSISIVLSFFGKWVANQYVVYNRNRKLNFVLKQLDGFMNDPITSKNHKEVLRQKREQIQLAVISNRIQEFEDLYKEKLVI
jgi:hypothetical protein